MIIQNVADVNFREFWESAVVADCNPVNCREIFGKIGITGIVTEIYDAILNKAK